MHVFLQESSVVFLGRTNYAGEISAVRVIEFAARNCYQSPPAPTFEEATKFVQRLGEKGHTSTYTHVQVTFEVDREYFKELWWDLSFTKYYRWFDIIPNGDYVLLSGSLRVWYESLKYYATMISMGIEKNDPLNFVYRLLVRDLFPHLFDMYFDLFRDVPIVPTITAITDPSDTPDELTRLTFYVVTDRAVTMEWDRHTMLGVSEESQRYMDYQRSGITFIAQPEIQIEHEVTFQKHLQSSADLYEEYRKYFKPQIARAVLPNATRVRSVFSGILPFWQHFVNLRTSEAAHPHIRRLAQQVKDVIYKPESWYNFDFDRAWEIKREVDERCLR